jgi:hypothetical protein
MSHTYNEQKKHFSQTDWPDQRQASHGSLSSAYEQTKLSPKKQVGTLNVGESLKWLILTLSVPTWFFWCKKVRNLHSSIPFIITSLPIHYHIVTATECNGKVQEYISRQLGYSFLSCN